MQREDRVILRFSAIPPKMIQLQNEKKSENELDFISMRLCQ